MLRMMKEKNEESRTSLCCLMCVPVVVIKYCGHFNYHVCTLQILSCVVLLIHYVCSVLFDDSCLYSSQNFAH